MDSITKRNLWIQLTLWSLAGLLAAGLLDASVSQWLREWGIDRAFKGSFPAELIKFFGDYWLVMVLLVWFGLTHSGQYRALLFMLFCGLPGLANALLKWVAGRRRPFTGNDVFDFNLFRDGWDGLIHPRNLSFASGHACQAFATMTVLAILFPARRIWFYTIAGLVALERVVENAHYPSDSVVGAAIGYFGVLLIHEWMKPIISMPVNFGVEPVSFPQSLSKDSSQESNRELMPNAPYFSLVIPAYNEQENIPTLLQRVEASLNQIGRPFEVLMIDDGSSDQTPQLLGQAQQTHPWLRVLRMKKNAGQSAAFEAGFAAARGEIIGTIDADLQNDPEEIPRLLPMLDEHKVDMITGWRKDRQDTKFRKWQSRQANRIRNWISQETVNDSASSLKLYRAHAIKGLKLFNGAHRFFPTLVKMRGFTCYETPVKHSHRFAGTAKYGFRNRAFRAFVDLLAVRWMKMRWLRYEVHEVSEPTVDSR